MSNLARRDFIKLSAMGSMGLVMGCAGDRNFDIIIKGGLVYDGEGGPPMMADIGIRQGKIAAVGDLSAARASWITDATGMAVSPGFIDIHTHTDTELLVNPRGESKVRQGVTTEVSGNCGYSPFPFTAEAAEEFHANLKDRFGLETSWTSCDGFLQAIEAAEPGINYATFTGHGNLRAAVVGRHDVAPTPEQLKEMQRILLETLESGSFGLATGLEYSPGSYAETSELVELSKVLAPGGGIYATHMRNEDDTVEEAIEEALRIGREAGVFTQISHLKACNHANWHKVDHMLELITEARKHQPVLADRYPYDAWGTGLTSFLPQWARQGDTDEVLSRLDNPDDLNRILDYAESRAERIGGWDRVLISSCRAESDKVCEGVSIQDGSAERGLEPREFVRELLKNNRNSVGVVGFAMDEGNLRKVLAAEFVMVASDGSAVAPYGALATGKPHPRFYGTFPRVLGRYVRETGTLELSDAIRKMTSMPADALGLKDRGRLKPGLAADIVVFNPAKVIDQATFKDPHQYPMGIQSVIVNGKLAVTEGEHTGKRAGMVLRHSV